MAGLKNRMGQDIRSTWVLSTEILVELFTRDEAKIVETEDEEDRWNWKMVGTYLVISYVLSLKGPKGLLIDLGGLYEYNLRKQKELVITLYGKIKGEVDERFHLMFSSNKTSSGIHVGGWIKKAMLMQWSKKHRKGPLFTDMRGILLKASCVKDMFREGLKEIWDNKPEMFSILVTGHEVIEERFSVFRTLGKSSDTRATEMNVSKLDVTTINRWNQTEKAGVKRPTR